MKLQALVLLAGTEQAAAISYENLEPEVVQCSSTTGPDSLPTFSSTHDLWRLWSDANIALLRSVLCSPEALARLFPVVGPINSKLKIFRQFFVV